MRMNIIKKYKWYLITLLLTLTVMTVFFAAMGCFSSQTILTSDMQGQTFPLLQYLKNVLNGDASFPYSFSKGLGGGMYGTMFYYLSNPLNLLVYFFDDISLFLLIAVILKISLCGLTMNIFLNHKFKENNWVIVIFSIAYALMGYNLNYYTNLMWIDGVIFAPIILIGIDRIIDGKKDWLYILTLFPAIICNYYIGYILCVFSAIYFLYNLLLKYDYKKDKKLIFSQIIHFFLITCFVGMMCAFILIPAAVELLNAQRVLTLSNSPLINWNFFDYFAPVYIGFGNINNPLNFYGFNIYCGTLMLLLVILYFCNSKISKKEKRLTAIVYLLLLLPITFNILNYLWHMFSVTVFFNYRFSFLATLFTIYIALKSYLQLEVCKKSLTITYIIMLIISSALLYLTYSAPDYYVYLNWKTITITMIFMLAYIMLLVKDKKKLAIGVLFAEIILNLGVIGYASDMSKRSDYDKYHRLYTPFVQYCEEKRCETTVGYTLNDAVYWNYRGVTTFFSTNNKNIYSFFYRINGVSGERNYFVYTYNNPVANMLLGIEYVMTGDPFNEYECVDVIEDVNIYKNNKALSLGYLVHYNAFNNLETKTTGISYLEEILNLLYGKEETYFVEIPVKKINDLTYEVTIETEFSYLYIYSGVAPSINGISKDTRELFVFTGDDYGILYNQYKGETLLLEFEDKPKEVKIYYLDQDKLDEFYSKVSQREFIIEQNTSNYIKGTVTVDEASILMLTIPYERGWTAKVNGEKVFIGNIVDTFMGIELSKGEYTIELFYVIHGLKEGIVVSVLAFVSLLLYELLRLKKKLQKNKKTKNWLKYNTLEKVAQKNKNIMIYLFVIAVISSISLILIPNINWGHDLPFHLSRISDIAYNLSTGNLGSYIYPNYLGGYGYGNPLFYPDVFLYIPATLVYLGMNLITAYKIFIFLISFFSILTMYITVKNLVQNKKAALFSATLYGLAAYRLVDVFSRAALGESIAFIFAPLVIYGIYEIIYRDYKKIYILVIGMTGLILSHIISSFIMVFLLLILCLVNVRTLIKEKMRIVYLLISALITVGLTSFFLFPMLEQMLTVDFTYETNAINLGTNAFPIWMFFIEMPYYWFRRKYFASGYGIGFSILIFLYFKNIKKKDSFLNFCFVGGIIFLLCSSKLFPWELFSPFLKYLQFPWRLYFFVTLLFCIGGGLLYTKIVKNTKTINLIIMICLLPAISICFNNSSARNIKEQKDYNIGSSEYLHARADQDFIMERGNVVTSKHDTDLSFEKEDLNLIISFENSDIDNELELPLLYYNGYQAKLNGTEIPVHLTDNGLVGVTIEKNTSGIIEVYYGGTKVQTIAKLISIVSWLLFLFYLTIVYKKRNIST